MFRFPSPDRPIFLGKVKKKSESLVKKQTHDLVLLTPIAVTMSQANSFALSIRSESSLLVTSLNVEGLVSGEKIKIIKAKNLQSSSLDPCVLQSTSGLSSDLLFDSDIILLLSTGNVQRTRLYFLVGLYFRSSIGRLKFNVTLGRGYFRGSVTFGNLRCLQSQVNSVYQWMLL